MAHPFAFILKIEGQPDVAVQGQFTDAEYSILVSFLEQYEEVAASKPLRDGFPCEVSVQWSEDAGMRVETSLPDPDTLSILLHRLRPFILKREPASFEAVCSVIGKRVSNPGVRQLLRLQRELYDSRGFQKMVRVRLNDTPVNSELLLQEWLNAHEYHRDPDKREAIDELFRTTPGDFARGILVVMIVDKVKAIRGIASLVHVLLTRGEQLTFQVPEA